MLFLYFFFLFSFFSTFFVIFFLALERCHLWVVDFIFKLLVLCHTLINSFTVYSYFNFSQFQFYMIYTSLIIFFQVISLLIILVFLAILIYEEHELLVFDSINIIFTVSSIILALEKSWYIYFLLSGIVAAIIIYTFILIILAYLSYYHFVFNSDIGIRIFFAIYNLFVWSLVILDYNLSIGFLVFQLFFYWAQIIIIILLILGVLYCIFGQLE